MHLTRLELDPRSAHARRDLADAYQMHRTLTRAFVRSGADKPPRFLWALEARQTPAVLVQSHEAPDWGPIRGFPYLARSESKEFDPAVLVRPGGIYRFRLLANPVVTQSGKRRGIVGAQAQVAWLRRQGAQHGFAIESAVVLANDVMESSKGSATIRVQRTQFEGVLQVEQASAVIHALGAGIGHGKAFGCGLLMIGRGGA